MRKCKFADQLLFIPKQVNKRQIKEQFNNCETVFGYCWQILVDLKKFNIYDNEFGKRLIQFQDQLADCLFDLQKLRNEITKERNERIAHKHKLNSLWFKKRMNLLKVYTEGIDQVTNIGKSLGDAYAYYFYQFESELLEKHQDREGISNFVQGMGGKGELAFLKTTKHINGDLTLYHGITNILRFGDFSFINLKKMRVTGIGELKTAPIDASKFEVNLTIIGSKTTRLRRAVYEKQRPSDDLYPPRLKRQINSIVGLFKKDGVNSFQQKIDNEFYYKRVQDLLESTKVNNFKLIQVSNGLIFCASRFRRAKLFTKIFERNIKSIIEKSNEQIIESIRSLIKAGSNYNSIILGQLLYDREFKGKNIRGAIPLFWSPFDVQVFRELYFLDSTVATLFNPIHLIEEVEALGCHVATKYKPSQIDRVKHKQGIDNFDLFIPFITSCLQTESFVIDAIKSSLALARKKSLKKVIIKTHQSHNARSPI